MDIQSQQSFTMDRQGQVHKVAVSDAISVTLQSCNLYYIFALINTLTEPTQVYQPLTLL